MGFEPWTPGLEGKPFGVVSSKGLSKKLGNIEKLLEKFFEFCSIDRRLAPRTAHDHVRNIRHYLQIIFEEHHRYKISTDTIRQYLGKYVNANPHTYSNKLKSIKVFHRDFLGYEEIVRTFKFPARPILFKTVPSIEDIRKFYNAISSQKYKAMFLFFATTGLRLSEVLSLRKDDVDLSMHLVMPRHAHYTGTTKKSLITFYNDECAEELTKYLTRRGEDIDDRLFTVNKRNLKKVFSKISEESGVKLTPQMLREWFCCEMGELSVADRYVDAFCGRVPKSILARHYTDYSPRKLKVIYDKAGLKVLQPSEISTSA